MSCSHSTRPDAGACSQCADVVVRKVTLDGPAVLVDGESTGRLVDIAETTKSYYARRGGSAHHAGRKPKP